MLRLARLLIIVIIFIISNTKVYAQISEKIQLSKDNQLFIIDPEFGFLGFKEFDLGIMAAHLIMATHDISYIKKIESSYPSEIDIELLQNIAGIEIMRRLIGLAQLPLNRTLLEKAELLTMAKNLILS